MWKRVSESIRGIMALCGELPLCLIEAVISESRPAGLANRRLGLSGSLNAFSRRARLLQQRFASRCGSRESVLYPTEQVRASVSVELGEQSGVINLRRKDYPMSFLGVGLVGSR